jgi:DNA invertase Pin-like site-specific DNA recombinase
VSATDMTSWARPVPEAAATAKALIYLRLGIDSQHRHEPLALLWLAEQRSACVVSADRCSAVIVEEFVDYGDPTPRVTDRPALRQLLERLKAADIAYVFMATPDRLARNYDDACLFVMEIHSRARLVFASGSARGAAHDDPLDPFRPRRRSEGRIS